VKGIINGGKGWVYICEDKERKIGHKKRRINFAEFTI
jgi:hypothetical protein